MLLTEHLEAEVVLVQNVNTIVEEKESVLR